MKQFIEYFSTQHMSICFQIQKLASVFRLLFDFSLFSGRTLTDQFKINPTAKTWESIKNLFVQLSVGSRKKGESLFLYFISLLSFFCVSGKKDFVLNGIPDWLYANTPELNGDTIAFSLNGSYLSFFSFNITNVQKYE